MSYKTKSATLKAKIRIFYIIFIWLRHLSLSPQLSLFAFLDTVIKRRQPKSTHRKFFILSVSSFEINYLNWTNQYFFCNFSCEPNKSMGQHMPA